MKKGSCSSENTNLQFEHIEHNISQVSLRQCDVQDVLESALNKKKKTHRILLHYCLFLCILTQWLYYTLSQ